MKNKDRQFVVLGLGRFGKSIAEELYKNGYEVLAVDRDPEVVQEVSSAVTHVVEADVTDEDVLRSLGIRNFDVAIIAIGDDVQSSIMATIIVKEMGVPYVLAKALNSLHARVLEKVGADRVVFPEKEMGTRIANHLISGHIMDYIDLSNEYSLAEMILPEEWEGKTLQELDLRSAYDVNVIAIRRGSRVDISPASDIVLRKNDLLVVIGQNDSLRKLNVL